MRLTSLSLVNCQLKQDAQEVLDAVATNATLEYLDLTGNQFGDKGTYALAKGVKAAAGLEPGTSDAQTKNKQTRNSCSCRGRCGWGPPRQPSN